MNNELPDAPVGRDELLDHLASLGFEFSTLDHPPFFTVEDGRDVRAAMEGGHTKNLFLKDKKSNYFLLTAQDDTEIDLKSLHRLLGGSGRLSFGSAEKMQDMLGVTPGSVTAFAVINDRHGQVKFAMDKRLLEHEKVNCHPMTNKATTTLRMKDLLRFAELCDHPPQLVDLAGSD